MTFEGQIVTMENGKRFRGAKGNFCFAIASIVKRCFNCGFVSNLQCEGATARYYTIFIPGLNSQGDRFRIRIISHVQFSFKMLGTFGGECRGSWDELALRAW